MIEEMYADLVSAVHVTGNVVKVDLMTRRPKQDTPDGQPYYELTGRLVMPIGAFLSGHAFQADFIRQISAQPALATQASTPEQPAHGPGVEPTPAD